MDDMENDFQRVIRRHHRERRELQDQIQALKSSVPKRDRRSQVLAGIAHMETEMQQRHQQELEKFEDLDSTLESVTASLKRLKLEDSPPCPSKTQKKRKRRAHLESQPHKRMPVTQAEQLTILRSPEEEEKDQLAYSVRMQSLFYHMAHYMKKHIDDFLPFFTEPEAGNLYTPKDFLRYCDDIVHSSSWGGQLELKALSHVLKMPIEVVNSPIIVIGEEYAQKPIILVYLHYTCDFGEHYSSVKPIETPAAAPVLEVCSSHQPQTSALGATFLSSLAPRILGEQKHGASR
ncbi:hypothetical protein STEG23_016325 [Scotinomys teguina]